MSSADKEKQIAFLAQRVAELEMENAKLKQVLGTVTKVCQLFRELPIDYLHIHFWQDSAEKSEVISRLALGNAQWFVAQQIR